MRRRSTCWIRASAVRWMGASASSRVRRLAGTPRSYKHADCDFERAYWHRAGMSAFSSASGPLTIPTATPERQSSRYSLRCLDSSIGALLQSHFQASGADAASSSHWADPLHRPTNLLIPTSFAVLPFPFLTFCFASNGCSFSHLSSSLYASIALSRSQSVCWR